MSVRCTLVATLLALFAVGPAVAADPTTTATYTSGGRPVAVARFDPAGPGPHAALVLLHGLDGYNEATYHLMASRLAGEGYVVFVPRYFDRFAGQADELAHFREHARERLASPDGPDRARHERVFHDCLETVSDAVRHVHKQPGVDGQRIGIVGVSLGGFLALAAATQPELKVATVVEVFGGLPAPLHDRAGALPPVLVLHGDADRVVPVEAARSLEAALKAKGRPHQAHVYRGVGHGFLDARGEFQWPAALDAEARTLAFLHKHLK